MSIFYCIPLRRKPPTPNEAAIAALQAESRETFLVAPLASPSLREPHERGIYWHPIHGRFEELPPIGAVYPVGSRDVVAYPEDADIAHLGRRVCVKAPPPPDFGEWVDTHQDPPNETPDDDAEVVAGYATVGPLYEPFTS